MLLEADEFFLTNSIYNMRWVAAIADREYSSNQTRKIFDSILKTNKEIFC